MSIKSRITCRFSLSGTYKLRVPSTQNIPKDPSPRSSYRALIFYLLGSYQPPGRQKIFKSQHFFFIVFIIILPIKHKIYI